MTDDPIGDALRADADAARAEIRAAGIVCPSCGVNMADLDESHMLTLKHGREYEDAPLEAPTAQCNYGQSVPLANRAGMSTAEFEVIEAAANVALYDDYRKNLAEAFDKLLGGPA